MTKPVFSPSWMSLTVLLFLLLPAVASAEPSYCTCPSQATNYLSGELTQNTCSNLETNLYSNLRSWANGVLCDDPCGACFYSYTTHYPSCTTTSDGRYIQAGTLWYACGQYVGPELQ
ncbi:MAG TPA: hypothetical protein VF789_02085 [Thermoanaerobaculia bacterium]